MTRKPSLEKQPQTQTAATSPSPGIARWMTGLLWCAAGVNLVAGLGLFFLFAEGYQLLGLPKPPLALPTQLVGLLVILFGYGYAMVARNPLENGNVLALGGWSKALGSFLVFYHYFQNNVPWQVPVLVLFGDVAWLIPFWIIHRRIKASRA